MKPRHWVYLVLGLALVLVPISAEVSYRCVIRQRVADLHDQIGAFHPDWPLPKAEYWRFGSHGEECSPSLTRDLLAWATAQAGWKSELLREGPDAIRNSYHCVGFESRPEADKEGYHAFLWSPQRLVFVPFRFGNLCRVPGCPWRTDIRS